MGTTAGVTCVDALAAAAAAAAAAVRPVNTQVNSRPMWSLPNAPD